MMIVLPDDSTFDDSTFDDSTPHPRRNGEDGVYAYTLYDDSTPR